MFKHEIQKNRWNFLGLKIQLKFCIYMQVTLEFFCSMFQYWNKFLWQNIGTTKIDTTVTWVSEKLNWLCGGYINDLGITRSQAVCYSAVSANTWHIFPTTTCSQMLHMLSLTVILVASCSILWTILSVQKKFAHPDWTVIASLCHVLFPYRPLATTSLPHSNRCNPPCWCTSVRVGDYS